MERTTQLIRFNSEKKHSVRYDGTGEKPIATSIYIMKTSLGSAPFPREIRLTIEEVEG